MVLDQAMLDFHDFDEFDLIAVGRLPRIFPHQNPFAVIPEGAEFRLAPLGSGSDYSAFLQHLGIAAIDLGFGGEDATGGSYHSVYDSFHHFTTFDDPGLKYGAALSKLVGRLVLRAARRSVRATEGEVGDIQPILAENGPDAARTSARSRGTRPARP